MLHINKTRAFQSCKTFHNYDKIYLQNWKIFKIMIKFILKIWKIFKSLKIYNKKFSGLMFCCKLLLTNLTLPPASPQSKPGYGPDRRYSKIKETIKICR